MATCDRACTVSAWAQMPKARGARKGLKTSRRTATLTIPGKAARIRLKLSKKSKRQLQAVLRKKKKVALTVTLSVGRRERRNAEELHQEGRRQAAEAPLAARLGDRLLQLALAERALDPRRRPCPERSNTNSHGSLWRWKAAICGRMPLSMRLSR